MPIGANQYYSDPTIGRIGSNLATAIYGDPEARLKRGLYDAQTANYGAEADRNRADTGRLNAEADKFRAETTGLGITNNARNGLEDALSGFSAPLPGEAPQDTFTRNAPAVAKFMRAFPGTAEQGAAALRTHLSTIWGLGDPDQTRRSLILDGKEPGIDFSPTQAVADQNAGRNSALKTGEEVAKQQQADRGSMGRTIYTQGQENSRNASDEAGRNSRFYNTPIETPAGGTTTLSPTDPRSKTFGSKIYGRTDTTSKAPSEVTAKDLEDVIFAAAQQIPGATMPDPTKPGDTVINPGWEAQFPPQKVIQARTAAAGVFQTTRNAQSAVSAYLQTLGVKPGSTFQPAAPATFRSLWMGGSTPAAVVPPADATPAPVASTPAPPMGGQIPTVSDPSQLPPVGQRQPGMKVNIQGRGTVAWSGTGWVPSQ